MQYDPVKRSLGNVFNRSPFLRKVFYGLLDLLLLRAWHVHKELRGWMRTLKTGTASVYDAGAGYGQYSFWLSSRVTKAHVLALDVKEEQVADCNVFFTAIGRPQVKFAVGDVTKHTDPGVYDLVVCVDVMEHILEDEAAMRCYSTSLKTGGMLIISTPSDQGGSDVHDGDEGSFIEEHVRDGYNLADIQVKLKRNGFSRTEAKYSYGTPGKISWRLSMKWPLLMLNTSKVFFIILPFYYILTYPFAYALNWLDVSMEHRTGTGLIVKAWK
ncbi:MAG: class I SAM-dependent methyltransferase [Flavobacteriales bacterium]